MEGFGEDMLIAKWDANLEKVRTIGEKLASTPPHPSNEHICRSGVAVISGGTTAFSILTLRESPAPAPQHETGSPQPQHPSMRQGVPSPSTPAAICLHH
eukprot:Em0010g1005a